MKKCMMKAIQYSLCAAAAMAFSGCAQFAGSKEDGKSQSFTIISSDTYQSFVKNWDDKKQPVFCALISSVQDWREWFMPAATIRYNPSFSPSKEYFADRQLLLVARVVSAPNSNERAAIFKTEKVTNKDGTLRLYYRLTPPQSGATYQVKEFLLVGVDKHHTATGAAQFFENGEQVCQVAAK